MDNCDIHFHFSKSSDHGTLIVVDTPFTISYNGSDYTIEEGYASNGMSVPRMFWSIISPQYDPSTLMPSIIHDWIYDHHVMSRKESDLLYEKMLVENGYPRWKARIVYCIIRLFGGSHW